MSAKEITNRLEEGSIHLGLTGDDLVQEKIENFENKVSKLVKLDFGKANLVVAVPNFWIDVYSMADLEEICNFMKLKWVAVRELEATIGNSPIFDMENMFKT